MTPPLTAMSPLATPLIMEDDRGKSVSHALQY